MHDYISILVHSHAVTHFSMDRYLDENELARLLIDRQLPRLDTISILLDSDFDGRVYYQKFEQFILNVILLTKYPRYECA